MHFPPLPQHQAQQQSAVNATDHLQSCSSTSSFTTSSGASSDNLVVVPSTASANAAVTTEQDGQDETNNLFRTPVARRVINHLSMTDPLLYASYASSSSSPIPPNPESLGDDNLMHHLVGHRGDDEDDNNIYNESDLIGLHGEDIGESSMSLKTDNNNKMKKRIRTMSWGEG